LATLTPAEARHRFLGSPVARLATVTEAGQPHLVPITFAPLCADVLVTAVDHKPKRTTALARLANLAVNPAVALLVDRYDDDWTRLWWTRADGQARVLVAGADDRERELALAPLIDRYGQYSTQPPTGPVILISVTRWSGWEAAIAR
jgi:PPOX class probable F420-dependent enzyme